MHQSLNRTALSATIHCLIGCSAGEILGMILTTALGWSAVPSVIISIVLAFLFGYSLSIYSVMRSGMSFRAGLTMALAADTLSITVMEIVNNGIVLIVPGAINAGLTTFLFWWSLIVSLIIAGAVAFPVNRALIRRGKGHALMHDHHH